jgi:hypothetical protein
LSSPEQTVFLYLTVTEQQYKKTVPEGEDSNMFSTQHLILDIFSFGFTKWYCHYQSTDSANENYLTSNTLWCYQ